MTYVISDLHGYPIEKLKMLLEKAGFCEDDFLYILGDVIDRNGDGKVFASVKVNENDMRFWARQYASQIKITEPKELVDMCKQDLANALALYQEL